MDINITQTDGLPHRLAIYSLDWDTTSRNQKIEMMDPSATVVYDTRSYSSFHNGMWHIWDVKVRVTLLGGANCVISGLFFGPATSTASFDYDNDGILDYLEDVNGDGVLNSGETNWQSATDLGLKVWITEPKANSIIP